MAKQNAKEPAMIWFAQHVVKRFTLLQVDTKGESAIALALVNMPPPKELLKFVPFALKSLPSSSAMPIDIPFAVLSVDTPLFNLVLAKDAAKSFSIVKQGMHASIALRNVAVHR